MKNYEISNDIPADFTNFRYCIIYANCAIMNNSIAL
jgi:hypothetical protein